MSTGGAAAEEKICLIRGAQNIVVLFADFFGTSCRTSQCSTQNALEASPVLGFSFFVKVRVLSGVQPLHRCFFSKKWTRTTVHTGHENEVNADCEVRGWTRIYDCPAAKWLMNCSNRCTLASTVSKHLRDGDSHLLFKERVAEELGDLLWYVANVAAKFDLKLGEIAQSNLQKTQGRY